VLVDFLRANADITYKLANEDSEELTNAWNIQQLRRFYP
jgi:hypothetical protein